MQNISNDYVRKDIYGEREARSNNVSGGVMETGFEDKIKHIKDKLLNIKKSKNIALNENLLGK